jgi:hypothetical protein
MSLKNNKAILIFIISFIALYFHELYRLSLGCPRVLGECYIDGAYDYYLAYAIPIYLIQICSVIFIYRLIKKFYYFLKPKPMRISPCGPMPSNLFKYLRKKKINEGNRK